MMIIKSVTFEIDSDEMLQLLKNACLFGIYMDNTNLCTLVMKEAAQDVARDELHNLLIEKSKTFCKEGV